MRPKGAAMQEIADWLEKLGMAEHAQRFAENKIDVSVLRYLTDQDLKDIGVPLGHRRKILAALGGLVDADVATTKPAPRPDTAERRQITVMFCDLVGSTELSARMDPEDLRDIMSAFQRCVVDTVHRFDGYVARYMGDGVLVYFGYPRAHEDDAERAVRAGLEVIAGTAALEASASLQARVGIATGLAIVGDLIGSGDAQERSIVGKTPNLAARMQAIAEPGTVVICDGTRKLLGNLFELKDLGLKDLKGIAEPTRAWAALRASSVQSRFEALRASGLTALVGRDEEFDLLRRRWWRAKSGEGQVVLLSGEAGIGKSRLTAALEEWLLREPHLRLRYFCSPQRTDSPLFPIIGQMERVAGLTRDDTPKEKLDKLDKLLARTSTSLEDAALFAEMLLIPNDGRYPPLEMPAEQRRQKTLDALFFQMQTLSRSRPVLVLFEDAHWTDPTSLEAVNRAIDRIASLRVLLVVSFRPEFDPPWIGRPHVTALTLNRLAQREVGTLIDHIVGDRLLPTGIRQDIIDRTDGVPLFVEEMTKAVLEAGSESVANDAVAAVPLPSLPVPASLHASLMARLDRLGAAKEVAQIGAAIGRSFSHALIAAVVNQSEPELDLVLSRLVAAGLLFRQGAPPHASYLFKHALVQDAAYGTLLREPRRALHARIAETLHSQFADVAERQPELLARHYTEAGLVEKAAAMWGKAGRRALEGSALVEATEQLGRALAQIGVLPSTPALRRDEIQLQVALITPLMHVKGYAAPETKAAAERARRLIEQAEGLGEPPEDPLLLFSVLHSFWTTSFVDFNGDALRELASQFLTLAEQRSAKVPLMIGHRIMGSVLHTGAIVEGRAHLDRAIAHYDPAEHRGLASQFGQDVRVAALSYRSWALWMLGYPEAALADTSCALSEAREIGQAPTLMYALVHAWLIHSQCGDYAAAKSDADELVALAEEKGASFWKALGMSVQGCLLVLTARPADAVQIIASSISALRSTGSSLWMPLRLPYLARACAEIGQFDNAWQCIDEAMTVVETTKERWHEAEIHRLAGEIALLSPQAQEAKQPQEAKAEAYFERALAVARAQQAKSWELRAAMSMARLWRRRGQYEQARRLLAPVYDWFTEGFDTLDLKQAKTLLDELAAPENPRSDASGPDRPPARRSGSSRA
jgi:class 3 adenylate cyclase/tetratricopeptide (TPR) repeat protein